ncbi:MAG: hypothetical protein JWR56_340, partial [Massilia sp.]|nr:hypothetical protein [Massilia sp.]
MRKRHPSMLRILHNEIQFNFGMQRWIVRKLSVKLPNENQTGIRLEILNESNLA